jgi:serine/threonine protein kinase
LIDLCRALSYAHGLTDEAGAVVGLVHRDVTPSNVMVGFDGTTKLLDFGIAKALNAADEQTKSGAIRGKMGYLAPEMLELEATLDQRADLFSVGVILHEMLVGRRLFKGADDLKTIALVRACRVEAPTSLRADVPPELERICLKALERERDHRYANAAEMERDLARVLRHIEWSATDTAAFLTTRGIRPSRAVLEMEPTLPEPVRARPAASPRSRWRVWLVAVGALALAGALVTSLRFRAHARDPLASSGSASTSAATLAPHALPAPAAASPVSPSSAAPTREVALPSPSAASRSASTSSRTGATNRTRAAQKHGLAKSNNRVPLPSNKQREINVLKGDIAEDDSL